MSDLDIKIYSINDAVKIEENTYNKALDDISKTILTRLTDVIYPKDMSSMTNLINEVAEELKVGDTNGNN